MKQREADTPVKKERDKQIDIRSRSAALNFVIAATQVLTVLCLVKGNPAWKGSLSLLFFGAAVQLLYKYDQYGEKPYAWVGTGTGLVGVALLVWFAVTG